MKNNRPDRRRYELGCIWRLLPTHERNSWLQLAKVIGGKHTPTAFTRIIDTATILAFLLMLVFPVGLRFIIIAICAGYVLSFNLAIMRICYMGVLHNWDKSGG